MGLVGLLKVQVDQLANKFHQLSDALRMYANKMDGPVDADLHAIVGNIWQLRPVGAINAFVTFVPSTLLARLLSMMDASKAAGAGELMLVVSPELLALEQGRGTGGVTEVQFRKDQQISNVGYATGD